MKLRRTRHPDVWTLLANGDVEGLIDAARFQDIKRDPDGRGVDQGVEVRKQAILALGELGAGAGDDTVAAALRDPLTRSGARPCTFSAFARRSRRLPGPSVRFLPRRARGSSRCAPCWSSALVRSARAAARSLVRAPGDAPLSREDIALLRGMLEGNERVVDRDGHRWGTAERAGRRARRSRRSGGGQPGPAGPISTAGVIGELANGHSPERAASLLGRIRDPDAMPALIAALENPRPEVRLQATAALGALRDPAAVEPLLRAAHDPTPASGPRPLMRSMAWGRRRSSSGCRSCWVR